MQFLVDDTPEECLSKAQGFFSTNWPYGGTFQPYYNHLHLEGHNPMADTWQHNLRELFLALIPFGVIILYWYIRLWYSQRIEA
jgi:hypothetical protein